MMQFSFSIMGYVEADNEMEARKRIEHIIEIMKTFKVKQVHYDDKEV